MTTVRLEHANLTVRDPARTARMLKALFGWHVRWEGEALDEGYTVHVGSEEQYLALYSPKGQARPDAQSDAKAVGLNHLGIVVDDLDKIEKRVLEAGFKPFSHRDYEPGRRFYFHDADGIEFEIISYA